MAMNQRLLMSRMMMARGRRTTTPAPAFGQLSAAESQAMMMNQMLPLLLMSQQANANANNAGVVGVDPSAPGSQSAPGERRDLNSRRTGSFLAGSSITKSTVRRK